MTAKRRGRVSINGDIVEPDGARISIFDRGFLYGDSIFETLRVYAGVPFAFDEHLSRFMRSGQKIGFSVPWSVERIRADCMTVLEAAGLDDAYLRIVGTRGAGVMGLDPGLASDPQLIVMVLELPLLPDSLYEDGRRAALVDVRRNLKVAVDPEAKTGNYINSVMAVREARLRGADEAIMLDYEGRVAEGSSANVFVWLDDRWVTPPLEVGILGGITRSTLLRIWDEAGLPVEVRVLWPDDLRKATEIFLCSSVREMVPIVELDGNPVGEGRVSERTKQLHAMYRSEIRRQIQPGI